MHRHVLLQRGPIRKNLPAHVQMTPQHLRLARPADPPARLRTNALAKQCPVAPLHFYRRKSCPSHFSSDTASAAHQQQSFLCTIMSHSLSVAPLFGVGSVSTLASRCRLTSSAQVLCQLVLGQQLFTQVECVAHDVRLDHPPHL